MYLHLYLVLSITYVYRVMCYPMYNWEIGHTKRLTMLSLTMQHSYVFGKACAFVLRFGVHSRYITVAYTFDFA